MKKVGERPGREFAARAASMMMFTRQRDQPPLNSSPAFTPPFPVSLANPGRPTPILPFISSTAITQSAVIQSFGTVISLWPLTKWRLIK